MKFCALYVCLLVSIYGCAPVEVREAVMTDGMKICATVEIDGQVCIVAEGQRYRHITWDGVTRKSEMIPRKERWAGMLGHMNSGYERWVERDGVVAMNYLEGQLHFSSETEASNFFKENGWDEKSKSLVYTHDGLVVYFEKGNRPDTKVGGLIDLILWQFMVNGQKPVNLAGSHDDNIAVYR